jgi:fructokinase
MSESSKGYLLAIGESLIDAITTNFVVDLSEAKNFTLQAGGSPANLCRFLQALGGKAILVAAIGKDGLGKILLKAIAQSGIDTTNIQQLSGHATSMVVVGRSRGTPDFIAYRDADQFLLPVEDALINGASVVHTTAFALSKAPAQQTILQALKSASDKGIAVSVDWNFAKPIWGEDNNAHHVLEEIMKYYPLLKISMDDINRFTDTHMNIEEAKAYLFTLPTSVTCLTCGADGVWFKSTEMGWQHLQARKVQVVDTTGAGDAFWAGFLWHWTQHLPIDICVQQGIFTAALRLEGHMK